MADDSCTLNGSTLLLTGQLAGKPISEWTSGIRIGRATYDDRQHAFYTVLEDFSAGFGYHNLDIREALGTHWDNPGGADLRRARHITLPPKRYRISANTNPEQMQYSAEILDGAAMAVPRDNPAAGQDSYLYYGAGDSVYRMDNDRAALTLVAQWVASGAAGNQIDMVNSITPPTKMTRMFLYRSPSDRIRRLYVITHDAGAAGPTSRYFFTADPGAASPTWKQGPRFLWDAIPATLGGQRVILAQETTFRFMYSADPLINFQDDAADTLTDWSIDASTPLDPTWIPNSVCRFLGEAQGYWAGGAPAVYFIDYGDGQLYALNMAMHKATVIPIGNYHYLLNGVIWEGMVAVTDGLDVWLYSAGGGTETVRKIGILNKDGVPDSLRDGRYRITGLVDGGRYLYAVAEYTVSGYTGFMVLVYNGTGWSLFAKAVEVLSTSEADTGNPLQAMVDRFPADVRVAAQAQTPITRALNLLCQQNAALVGPATDIAFVDGGAGADTITQTAAGFGVFSAGDTISVVGSTSNDGSYTIVSVVAGTITLATGQLTAEAAGDAVTVARTNMLDVQVHSFMLPKIGHIPIDGVDEFEGWEDAAEKGGGDNYNHRFITGWMDMGSRDLKGTLHYLKVDMQEALAGSRVDVDYRIDDDETAAWTSIGTAAARGTETMQFDQSGDNNGVEFRTVQFRFNINRVNGTIVDDADFDNSETTVTVDDTSEFPSAGLIQVDSEIIEYTGTTATTFTGCTRGARGTSAAAHNDDELVYSLNRTPEMRAVTVVYNKKAPMRQTWVGDIDVNKMVEQGTLVDVNDDGTPETAATHQNVWDWISLVKDKQTLVKLVIPEHEASVMVAIADFTDIVDDQRYTSSVRSHIPITFIEPVKAD